MRAGRRKFTPRRVLARDDRSGEFKAVMTFIEAALVAASGAARFAPVTGKGDGLAADFEAARARGEAARTGTERA